MSHIRILVCRVDGEAPDHLTELAGFDLPAPHPAGLTAATALDGFSWVLLMWCASCTVEHATRPACCSETWLLGAAQAIVSGPPPVLIAELW